MKKILLLLPVFALASCAEFAAFQSGVANHGAQAADEALETALWTICNASSVGAVNRRFKDEQEKVAYNVICREVAGTGAAAPLIQ